MGATRRWMAAGRGRSAGAPSVDMPPRVATARVGGRVVLADGARPGGDQRVRRPRRLRAVDAGVRNGVLATRALLRPPVLARPPRVQVLSGRNPGAGPWWRSAVIYEVYI